MTEIGIIGPAPAATVDGSGRIGSIGGPPRFGWWVGAEDRWHHAGDEPAVRQRSDAAAGAVETRLKVPGGDIVHRTTMVPHGGSGLLLVDIVNETPVPVAVAVTHTGGATVTVDGDALVVDGVPVLRAGRSVARLAVANDEATLRSAVESGVAAPPAELELPLTGSHAAAIYPLPHTARLRLVLGGDLTELPGPDSLPSIDDAGRGWDLHLEKAMRAVLPDDRLMALVEAARRHLLVGAGQEPDAAFWGHDVPAWAPATAAVALGMWGHDGAARELLLSATGGDDPVFEGQRTTDELGALVWAWSELFAHVGQHDEELARSLRPWIVDRVGDLVSAPRRRRRWSRSEPEAATGWRPLGLAAATSLLTQFGEDELAGDLADASDELAADVEPGSLEAALGGHRVDADGSAAAVLGRLVHGRLAAGEPADDADALDLRDLLARCYSAASPTGALSVGDRGQDPVASALLLIGLRRALVVEAAGIGGPLAAFSAVDRSWIGAPMQLHGVPVGGGSVEFAVRWHGDRPALLWDTHLDRPRQISAPGLDPDWSDDRPTGEDLLAATAGVEVEAGPESAQVKRGVELDPDDPQSFA